METFQKRQKAFARKEKRQKKAARKIERRNEKSKSADNTQETNPVTPESSVRQGPTIL
ncbi:MAG: hypothetical protein ACREP3_08415 [Candidatus Binatia bacterium]